MVGRDGIAVLVIGGPVLLWSRRRAMTPARWAELALVVLATAGLSVVALRFGASPFLVFLPILAWAAFRLGDLGAVLAGTAFACVVNYMTAAGYGSLAHLGLSPPARLAVTDVATRGKYATMAAAVIEPEVSLLTYATAGHPPILIRRAQTGTVEIPPPAAGPPLGIVRDSVRPEYTQNQVCLEPGDIMLMYTDGLIERRGEDLAEGIARVADQLEGWRPGRAFGPLCERLVSSLNVEPQLDDVCVLAVCMSAPNPDDPGVRAYRAGRG